VSAETFIVFPDPASPEITRPLDQLSIPWKCVADQSQLQLASGTTFSGAVVVVGDNPDGAFELCRTIRKHEPSVAPIILVAKASQLDMLRLREDLYDDFLLQPVVGHELQARIEHANWRLGKGAKPEVMTYGPLVLNVETYQASIDGKPMSLTYMEYELLKFLVTHPAKVHTRETLLSRVWGYEYYGGARTVDVHVRRLRSKFGEEHANLIETIRSVGYQLGQSRWS